MGIEMPGGKRIMEEVEVKERPIDKWVEKYGYHGYLSRFENQRHFVLEVKQANFLYDPPMPNLTEEENNKFIWSVSESDLGYLIPNGISSPMQYNLPIEGAQWIGKEDPKYKEIVKNLQDVTYGYNDTWGSVDFGKGGEK